MQLLVEINTFQRGIRLSDLVWTGYVEELRCTMGTMRGQRRSTDKPQRLMKAPCRLGKEWRCCNKQLATLWKLQKHWRRWYGFPCSPALETCWFQSASLGSWEPVFYPAQSCWAQSVICRSVAGQLDLAATQGNLEKQREYLWRVADAYDKAGYLDIAETHLKELLCLELSKEQKLEALCFLADIQVPGFLRPMDGAMLPFWYLTSAGSACTRDWGWLIRSTQILCTLLISIAWDTKAQQNNIDLAIRAQMKIEKMAQESRVQRAMEEQEQRFGRITRTISGSAQCMQSSPDPFVAAITAWVCRILIALKHETTTGMQYFPAKRMLWPLVVPYVPSDSPVAADHWQPFMW